MGVELSKVQWVALSDGTTGGIGEQWERKVDRWGGPNTEDCERYAQNDWKYVWEKLCS